MALEFSLAVVGALHSNADGSNRQFEVAMMRPGETVALVPDPRNKADPSAVAVVSERGIQLGYLTAERCGWIGGRIKQGQDIRAIFQAPTKAGAIIRVNLDGTPPTLPPPAAPSTSDMSDASDDDSGFYPDYIPPDD